MFGGDKRRAEQHPENSDTVKFLRKIVVLIAGIALAFGLITLVIFDDKVALLYFSDLSINVVAGAALFLSLIIVWKQKFGGLHGKTYTAFAIGLCLWFAAELLQTYYEKILSSFSVPGSHYKQNLPDNALTDSNSDYEQHGHFLAFSEGFLYGWSEKPYTESEIKILNRFKLIIDLTFRRYIELQKSETNTRDAVRQASLDRVRAEIASMRTTADLERL